MKRKMLISISLVVIMILNCILPLFVVNAAEGEEIRLNSKLYAAVRTSLTQQGIKFTSNDITHGITVEDISAVKKLNLNEGAISDLTGLDGFTALEHLELSGNNLTKDSNLGVLNNLSGLNYLDLSTNSLDNVEAISTLISELGRTGTIILSGQTVTEVHSVYVNTKEDSNNEEVAEFELPQILGLAGYVKSFWKSTSSIKETEDAIAPYITLQDVPMYVNSETPNVQVHIADENGNGYLGLAKLSIYIYDDATEAARANNVNRASENILNGSR